MSTSSDNPLTTNSAVAFGRLNKLPRRTPLHDTPSYITITCSMNCLSREKIELTRRIPNVFSITSDTRDAGNASADSSEYSPSPVDQSCITKNRLLIEAYRKRRRESDHQE